MIHNHVDYKPF